MSLEFTLCASLIILISYLAKTQDPSIGVEQPCPPNLLFGLISSDHGVVH